MKNNEHQLNIGVIGLWHLGCVYASSFARMGYKIEGFDLDKKVIENLKQGKAPVFEPELDETIKTHLGKNLSFTDGLKNFFEDKDYIFITYDLPVDEKDRVSTKLIEKVAKLIVKNKGQNNTFVISSQVPLGTCRKLMKTLSSGEKALAVIYFPENVRLGKGFETFMHPDRIILGSDTVAAMEKFATDFADFNCEFIKMGLESAEMVKHALNSYLATCVSYSSEIADLCELLGADMNEVVKALKTDRRVSPFAPINPGMGFAGATLGRDVQGLKKLGASKKYWAKMMNSVYEVNRDRLPWLLQKIKKVKKNLKGVNIGILGLTYKPGTNTLRRSMSLEFINLLEKEKVNIRAFDPVIKDKIEGHEKVTIAINYEQFFKDLNMVILMTEWPEFKELPIEMAAKLMKEKIVFDTKNFLDKNKFVENGYMFIGTGY